MTHLTYSGGDFQCALDGNFSQRRNKKAGQCPPIKHLRRSLVPKEFIDAEMALFLEQAKDVDIIITTVRIAGPTRQNN